VTADDRRFRYALDYLSIAAASCVALATGGLARALALGALALSAALLWLRSRSVAASQPGVSVPGRVALGAVALVLVVALGHLELPAYPERLPFQAPRTGHLPEDTRECLQRPPVVRHLRALHDRVLRSWSPPAGMPAGQQVIVELLLLPSGAVSNPRVVSSSYEGLGPSAVAAVRAAAPFAPLGPDVACLAGAPARLLLSNPIE
jgi:hypothetical protein